jgi:hypothetical protein
MSDSDRYYGNLPGRSAYTAQPSGDRPPTRQPRRGRQPFRSRSRLVVGAIAALIFGLVLLVVGPSEAALALQLEGTPGALTVSSCMRQPDGKSYDYACIGDFHATKGTLNITDASYTSVDNLTGHTVTLQRGPDGGYYAVSAASAAMWIGFSVFGLVLVSMFLLPPPRLPDAPLRAAPRRSAHPRPAPVGPHRQQDHTARAARLRPLRAGRRLPGHRLTPQKVPGGARVRPITDLDSAGRGGGPQPRRRVRLMREARTVVPAHSQQSRSAGYIVRRTVGGWVRTVPGVAIRRTVLRRDGRAVRVGPMP